MLQSRGEFDFAFEALGAYGFGDLVVKNLQRHGAVMSQVLRKVDGGEPTAAKLTLDAVAVVQGGFESVARGQSCLLEWGTEYGTENDGRRPDAAVVSPSAATTYPLLTF